MARIAPIDPAQATSSVRDILDQVNKRFGAIPNFFLAAGRSPAFSEAHMSMWTALEQSGGLPAGLREQIAIGVAQYNGCGYCLPAHTMVGTAFAGLSEEKASLARRFTSPDPKEQACLRFAQAVLETKGAVSDAELERVRAAGYTDAEIGAILGDVVLNILRNYFNRLAQTEVDPFFPKIDPTRLDVEVPV